MSNDKVKFLLNWNHFGEHLCSCMVKLMTDSSYSDIIIATADKRMIYSHRFVLANCSKYFQRLLKKMNKQQGIQLVVALPEIKYEIFKILMNYMYKGETQVPHELLPSVIKAGQLLEIIGLVNLKENDSKGSPNPFSKDSKSSDGTERKNPLKRKFSTLSDSKENAGLKCNTPSEKTKMQSGDDNHSSKSPKTDEREENCLTVKKNLAQEKRHSTPMLLRRKTGVKEFLPRTSVLPQPSSLSAGSPSTKIQRLNPTNQEPVKKIKEEIILENSKSPGEEENDEFIDPKENVIVKLVTNNEVPDEDDLAEYSEYNKLQCEYCNTTYSTPAQWVRHMTTEHGERGYKSRDFDERFGSTLITCVVCSAVCFSAAEWAKHLQMWHSEQELTLANLQDSMKSSNMNPDKSHAAK